MSEKSSEKRPREMSAICEASSLLKEVSGPWSVGDSVKGSINRAARRLGWSFSRTKDLWYQAPGARVSGDELLKLYELQRKFSVQRDEVTQRIEQLEARVLALQGEIGARVFGP